MPTILMHLPRRRSGARLGDGLIAVEHACLPRPLQFEQLMVTLLYRVMVVSWLSALAAAVVPVLRFSYKQARTLVMNSSHRHVFLGLCCASDSELAAANVKHSVAIRVFSSPEDLQLVSTRRVLHRLLRIAKILT